MPSTNPKHPCLSCGACCAAFRVSFNKTESEPSSCSWIVPSDYIENFKGEIYTLKGTDHKHRPFCKALLGTIGKSVACSIYGERPSPCRNFHASFEKGIHNSRCDEARKKYGLSPLKRKDFVAENEIVLIEGDSDSEIAYLEKPIYEKTINEKENNEFDSL